MSRGGGAQARTESRKTVLIVGWASRPVLEEMSSSWRPGYGIIEAMRGSVLGACSCGGLAGEATLIEARGGRRFMVELRCGALSLTKDRHSRRARDALGALK